MIGGRLLRAAARCAAPGAAAHAAAPPPTRLDRAPLPPAAPPAAPSLREHGLLAGVSEPGAVVTQRLDELRPRAHAYDVATPCTSVYVLSYHPAGEFASHL
jgi:hypothetical protein